MQMPWICWLGEPEQQPKRGRHIPIRWWQLLSIPQWFVPAAGAA